MRLHSIALLAAALLLPGFTATARAQPAADEAAAASQLADGEIRKIDREARKITIRHGPIPNLDMPAITMVLQVKDPALLDAAKPGDKVCFAADKAGGACVVTRIEPAR